MALCLGAILPMTGKLQGHRQVQTIARYANHALESVLAAAEGVVVDSLAVNLDNPF